jgi:hypothetical protein
VAFEVAGDGVEAGGEEDALVAGATPEGDSVKKDMFAGLKMRLGGIRDIPSSGRVFVFKSGCAFWVVCVFDSSIEPMRDDPADKWRCGCRK